jgi:hypothetical protein
MAGSNLAGPTIYPAWHSIFVRKALTNDRHFTHADSVALLAQTTP